MKNAIHLRIVVNALMEFCLKKQANVSMNALKVVTFITLWTIPVENVNHNVVNVKAKIFVQNAQTELTYKIINVL